MLNNEGANDNHGGKASTMNMKKIERLKQQLLMIQNLADQKINDIKNTTTIHVNELQKMPTRYFVNYNL